ncbi:MAG: recombinase family protein [Pirellulales bacterium]
MNKVAVYVRVSTDEQENGLQSQKKAIQRWLKGHSIRKADWYSDKISGTKDKRPGLDKLRKAIFNGEVDTVVVWSLSRLTRKGAYEGLTMLAKWLDKGVRVVSIAEQFDFYGSTGELVAAVLFAVAKMQRDELSNATRRGLAAAKERGVKLGKRPGKWTAEVKALHEKGMSMTDIAKRFGKTRQAVWNVLNGKTPVYRPAKANRNRW